MTRTTNAAARPERTGPDQRTSVAVRPVHPALRGCLDGPVVGYDVTLPLDAVHLGIPGPHATVIVAFDDPLDVGWLAEPDRSTRRWASVSGLHLRPALIRTHGIQRGIQLSLTPVGCRSLFGVPMAALAGETVDLAELPRGLTDAEYDRLASAPTWSARLALVEEMLLVRFAPDEPSRDVAHAWSLLIGGVGVAETADAVGWSRRHLVTLVRAEAGMTPKQLHRLGRFQRARSLVLDGAALAEAAYAAGFADQSHLSREWSALAGRPPSLAGEEFPNLHDVLGPARPDSRS